MKKKSIIFLVLVLTLFSLSACTSKANEKFTEKSNEKATQTSINSQTSFEKSAVIYFSATGTTKGVAEVLAKETGSDLLEIKPLNPYKTEDLTYSKECRANSEQADPSARPEIRNDLKKAEEYDTIYLGYPVWWGTNPRIIQTFIEKYDLSNAEIYLFCTSGGSGIETSVNDLKTQYPNLNIIAGNRFSGDSQSEITAWLNTISK